MTDRSRGGWMYEIDELDMAGEWREKAKAASLNADMMGS